MSLLTALIVLSQLKVLVGDKKRQNLQKYGGTATNWVPGPPWPQRRTAPGKTPVPPLPLRVLLTDWLCAIERDLKPLNLGLHSALPQAADRSSYRRMLDRCVAGISVFRPYQVTINTYFYEITLMAALRCGNPPHLLMEWATYRAVLGEPSGVQEQRSYRSLRWQRVSVSTFLYDNKLAII